VCLLISDCYFYIYTHNLKPVYTREHIIIIQNKPRQPMQPYIDYLLNAKGYTTKTRKRKHRAPIYRSNRTLRPNHYSQQRVDHAGAAERAELPSICTYTHTYTHTHTRKSRREHIVIRRPQQRAHLQLGGRVLWHGRGRRRRGCWKVSNCTLSAAAASERPAPRLDLVSFHRRE